MPPWAPGLNIDLNASRGHQTNLKIQWKRLNDTKRSYELRCREEVASNQFYHQEVSRLGKNSRDAEKVQIFYDLLIILKRQTWTYKR